MKYLVILRVSEHETLIWEFTNLAGAHRFYELKRQQYSTMTLYLTVVIASYVVIAS
jgi:hypothetical protein